jgi:hypothetical protein
MLVMVILFCEHFFDDMTAIVILYTKAGLIVAADGRARVDGDPTEGTEDQQKIFPGSIRTAEIAWALSGNVFNKDKSFSLFDEVKESMKAANSTDIKACTPWLEFFASHLRNSVSDLRNKEVIAPFVEDNSHPDPAGRFTFATVFMAGYFCNGRPSSARIYLMHEGGRLIDPPPFELIAASFTEKHNAYYGSLEIALRYHNRHHDKRFLKYFHPSGRTLEEGLAHAKGYIEACCDQMARELDPVICQKIGGHIHAAAVTPSGFEWLILPI